MAASIVAFTLAFGVEWKDIRAKSAPPKGEANEATITETTENKERMSQKDERDAPPSQIRRIFPTTI